MVYKNPKNIFQERISNVVTREKTNMNILDSIFKLQHIFTLDKVSPNSVPNNSNSHPLLEIYNILGPIKFAEVVATLKGATVTFPTEKEYQDSLVTSLCYYYKEVEGLSWDEIKLKLEMQSLNTIQYSLRVRSFKNFVDTNIIKQTKE